MRIKSANSILNEFSPLNQIIEERLGDAWRGEIIKAMKMYGDQVVDRCAELSASTGDVAKNRMKVLEVKSQLK